MLAALIVCLTTSPGAVRVDPSVGLAQPSPGVTGRGAFRGFIENNGQWESDARFVADFDDLTVRAELGAIVAQGTVVKAGQARLGVVRLAFEGAETAEPMPGGRAPGEYHFLLGGDPSRWRQHVPTFESVLYPQLYAGTDVRLREREGGLEYDLYLSPLADANKFVVHCEGVDGLTIDASGELRMDTALGPLVQRVPIAWQQTNGQTLPATCNFRILDQHRFGIAISDRIDGSTVVIDPGLTWATFLGGSDTDEAHRVRVSPAGQILVAGASFSRNFPVSAGVFDTTLGDLDATLTCLQATDSSLVFSTFVGGSDRESGDVLDVASNGDIVLGGYTESTDFPTLATSYDQTLGGSTDAFVGMLTPDGADLVFSTYLGGSGPCLEELDGLALTSSGLIVCAGLTCDTAGFPVTSSAFQSTSPGWIDGFVTWFDPSLSGPAQLVCSSYLGTRGSDEILDLTMGPDDEPIAVGTTSSADFPTTPGAYDETPGGHFISRLSADGSSLVASTHFKSGKPLAVTTDGDSILVAGDAIAGLPVSANAFDPTLNGGHDGFVARFDGQLSQVLQATYIGGSSTEAATGIAVDPAGGIVVVGVTGSANYPTTPGAFDTEFGGVPPMATSMVSYLSSDLGQLFYSSYLAPAQALLNQANDVCALGVADVVLVGQGATNGFPATPGAFDETFNGGLLGDGYVARMLLTTTWNDLGGSVPGSNGTPMLTGTGDLAGGSNVTLTLRHGLPNGAATVIVGAGLLNAPFKGGMLIPTPTLLVFGLPISANGTLVLSATWPLHIPSALTIYFQEWIPDPAGPAGFAASNGLSGTTP